MAKQKNNEDLSIARSVLDLAVGFVTSVEEADGTIEDARRAIFKDENLKRQLGLLVMGKLKLEGAPCQRLVPHLLPNWVKEVVEDVEPIQLDPAKLKFIGFLREGDGNWVDSATMRMRAVELKANRGLSDVPALLGEDGKGLVTIPAELRGKAYIVLSGTLLRYSDGDLYVPYLSWDDDRWVLDFGWLGHDWDESDRLVSCE